MGYENFSLKGDCLRKFIVNFSKLKNYKGEFGFSNISPEIINKIVYVKDYSTNKKERKELLVGYSKDTNLKNSIQSYMKLYNYRYSCMPWGFNYITSYISLFPKNNCKGERFFGELNVSIHQLTILRDDDLPLTNDGTIIEFECENKSVIITPKSVNLSSFLKKRLKKNYIPNNKDESVFYYDLDKPIKVEVLAPLNNSVQIKVIAKRNKTREQVGLIVALKNDKIKHAKIKIVDVVYDASQNIPLPKEDLVKSIKFRSLNQALIRSEVFLEKFILGNYLHDIEVQKFVKEFPKGSILAEEGDYSFFEKEYFPSVKKLYAKLVLKNKNVDSEGEYTYLFRGSLESDSGSVEGIASASFDEAGKAKFLSSCMIPGGESSLNLWVHLHELCHTFGATHIFEKNKFPINRPVFYQAYTDNILDYEFGNSNTGKMYGLEFWQWSEMNKDSNLR